MAEVVSVTLRPADLGVEAFFPKPFDVDKLLWHVRDLLAVTPSGLPYDDLRPGRP